jgi:hypothetical protein
VWWLVGDKRSELLCHFICIYGHRWACSPGYDEFRPEMGHDFVFSENKLEQCSDWFSMREKYCFG